MTDYQIKLIVCGAIGVAGVCAPWNGSGFAAFFIVCAVLGLL